MILAMFIILVILTVIIAIMFGYCLGERDILKDAIEDLKAKKRDKRRKK